MAARRHVTNKLRSTYQKSSKKDRGRILDEVMATTGMGRSTARRMLTGPALLDPTEQVDQRKLRPKTYSDDAGALLEHVWALMGCPCGKVPDSDAPTLAAVAPASRGSGQAMDDTVFAGRVGSDERSHD